MNSFRLIENYRDQPALREAFFDFTETIFRLSFRRWHELGHWDDRYCCVSLHDGSRIIANVSYSRLTLLVNGSETPGIQIATVGTLPGYRNLGLSRQLMEHVMARHAAAVALSFLFANETVLDFTRASASSGTTSTCLSRTWIAGPRSSRSAASVPIERTTTA